MEFAPKLAHARQAKIDASIELMLAEQSYAIAKARSEILIIEEAGGVKELGSNAEMQARALLVRLSELNDLSNYKLAEDNLLKAKSRLLLAAGTLDHLLDARRDYENFLKRVELHPNPIPKWVWAADRLNPDAEAVDIKE